MAAVVGNDHLVVLGKIGNLIGPNVGMAKAAVDE